MPRTVETAGELSLRRAPSGTSLEAKVDYLLKRDREYQERLEGHDRALRDLPARWAADRVLSLVLTLGRPAKAAGREPRRFQDLWEWARQDSNLGPTDYESAALTAELQARPAAD